MAIFRTSGRRFGRRPLRKSVKARRLLRPRVSLRDARALSGLPTRPPSFYVPGSSPGLHRETLVTTLRYSDNINLAYPGGVGGIVGNIFRMNSAFDPDFTGTGHQPLYFDQFAAVYGQYTVLSAKLTVTFASTSHDTDAVPKGPYAIGITGNNSGTFASTTSGLQEAEKSVYTLLARDDAGPAIKTLTLDYVPQRDIGLPPTDDTIGASISSNPLKPFWAYVWFGDVGGVAANMNIQVTLEQKIKFWAQGFTAAS